MEKVAHLMVREFFVGVASFIGFVFFLLVFVVIATVAVVVFGVVTAAFLSNAINQFFNLF